MAAMVRRRASGGFELPLVAADAISLFTPEGERDWVPGWLPRYPGGPDEAPGTVFTTEALGRETIWVILEIDRSAGRAAYARTTRNLHAGTVRVDCVDIAPQRCTVSVSYDLTTLSDAGTLDEYRPEPFAETMQAWLAAVEDHLATRTAD